MEVGRGYGFIVKSMYKKLEVAMLEEGAISLAQCWVFSQI